MFRIAQADKPKPIHWTPRKIERLTCILRGETKRFLFRLWVRAQVDERNFDVRRGWMDDLHALAAVPVEGRSPGFMPANNFSKTALQG